MNINNKNYVYLFKSAGRDIYKRYFLTILSLPESFIFSINYDDKYFNKDSDEEIKALKGLNGLLIFFGKKTMKYRKDQDEIFYIPIREITLESLDGSLDKGFFTMYIKLGKFIDAPSIFNREWVEKFTDMIKNKLRGNILPGFPGEKYILAGDSQIEFVPPKIYIEEEAWCRLIKYIYKLDIPDLRDSYFFYYKGIRNQERELKNFKTKPDRNQNPESIYKLWASKSYDIALFSYCPNYDNLIRSKKRPILKVNVREADIKFEGESEIRLEKYKSYSIPFNCIDRNSKVYSNITIFRPDNEESSPYLNIPIFIRPLKRKKHFIYFLIIFGLIASALSKTQPFSFPACDPEKIWQIIDTAGIIIVTSSLLYLTIRFR